MNTCLKCGGIVRVYKSKNPKRWIQKIEKCRHCDFRRKFYRMGSAAGDKREQTWAPFKKRMKKPDDMSVVTFLFNELRRYG